MSAVIRGHYRAGSIRGPGVRIRWKRQEVSRWLFAVSKAFPDRSSAVYVAGALASVMGQDGRLDPTHQWIAEKIDRSTKTVVRVLQTLRKLGFLTWQRRIAVTAGVEHQTSNAYQLHIPEPQDRAEAVTGGLSTSPLSSMSVYREESILSDSVSSDIPPPAPDDGRSPAADPPRPLPYRAIQEARKTLADRVAAFNQAWRDGAGGRAAALKQRWSGLRTTNNRLTS